METVWALPTSTAHDTLIWFGEVAVNLQRAVTFIGRGGRLGSAPGLFVGIGLGRGHSLLFTWKI